MALVFGGRSGEHEVSLRSARSIFDALDRERYEPVLIGIDHDGRWHLQDAALALLDAPGTPLALDVSAPKVTVAPSEEPATLVPLRRDDAKGLEAPPPSIDVFFPVLHGTYGEDGTLQGLLEMAGVPYVGSGVLGSSTGMDKDFAKRLLRSAGIPVVDGFALRAADAPSPDAVADRVEATWGWPAFVKPANMGSSVGVSKARDRESLAAAMSEAFRYDTKLLVERGHQVREIEVAVLGNDRPEASVPGEIVPTHEFYSYEAKYLDENGAALRIPAPLDEALTERVRALAIEAFRALDLAGLARVDFFLDKDTGELFVNEVNTLPGFTRISMYPKLWEASGLSYPRLVDRLIALAQERHRVRQGLSTRYRAEH